MALLYSDIYVDTGFVFGAYRGLARSEGGSRKKRTTKRVNKEM